MDHKKARSLVEQHFVDALPAAKFASLKEHLDGCGDCRAHYDRLFGFEAAYDGGKGEAERIGEAVFAQLDRELKPARAGIFAFTWPFPTIAALAVAGLALFVVSTRSSVVSQPSEFEARGGPEVDRTKVLPELAAVCFVDRGHGPEEKHDLKAGAEATCPRGGKLVLAVRQARPGDAVVVFAVKDGEATQLVPPPSRKSLALPPGQGTTPLPGSFNIAESADGAVSLVAVFGPEVDAEKLKAAASAGQDLSKLAGQNAAVQTLTYRPAP